MTYTAQEIIERLQEIVDTYGPDIEVMWAAQPNWPFEYSISDIVEVENFESDDPDDVMIYIVEGQQTRYLPGHVCREIGWS